MAKDFRETILANKEFPLYLGMFYATWTSADITIDYAIGRFLGISAENTLVLTSGMVFGNKIRMLCEFINRSDDKNKSKIISALKRLRGEAKRDIFAHSYLIADEKTATFIHRPGGGEFKVALHTYTLEEWKEHVRKFQKIGTDLWEALGQPQREMENFAKAALKSVKS